MARIVDRMVRAAKLEVVLYEEVEADTTATGQAMAVVLLSSVAAGIGSAAGLGAMLAGAVGAIVGWLIWAGLTFLIGTKLLPEPQTSADFGQMLRTIGFAASPGLIRVLGIVPVLRPLVLLVAAVWMLVATVVAVRQALDFRSTGRAIAVCVIGWAVQLIVLLPFSGLLR